MLLLINAIIDYVLLFLLNTILDPTSKPLQLPPVRAHIRLVDDFIVAYCILLLLNQLVALLLLLLKKYIWKPSLEWQDEILDN